MKTINIFYQIEGIKEINHIEVGPEDTFATVKALVVEKHNTNPEALIFLEDSHEPLNEAVLVIGHAGPTGIKAHFHRCHQIAVTVTFNGETVEKYFAPGTTVSHVKLWAAKHKFGMTEEEAGEHVMQISGAQDRPMPGTHLGTLVTYPNCKIAFDLVPDERINGAFPEAPYVGA